MQMSKIIKGRWYETKQGIGVAVVVGGTHPPSVQVNIRAPFPRGIVNLKPSEVLREVEHEKLSIAPLS
jgi:hypothetical protein